MKALVLNVALLLAAFGANAANEVKNEKSEETKSSTAVVMEVSGVVIDQETQEALVGVKVELEGTDKVAYTDFDGNYSFGEMKVGDYKVVASYVSYESATVKADANKSISLKSAE